MKKLILALLLVSSPAWAALRSSTNNSASSSTHSCTVPAGVAADDIIVLFTTVDGAPNTNGATPSGFTAFFSDTAVSCDGGKVSAAWKRATGADTGTYDYTAGTNTVYVCQAYAFSGRDTGNPPVASTAAVQSVCQTSAVTATANGVTALAGDDLLWANSPDSTAGAPTIDHTAPSGYTEKQDFTSASFASLSGATKENVGAGATGSVSGSFTLSTGTAGWVADLVRIPVAAGGATCTNFMALLGAGCK